MLFALCVAHARLARLRCRLLRSCSMLLPARYLSFVVFFGPAFLFALPSPAPGPVLLGRHAEKEWDMTTSPVLPPPVAFSTDQGLAIP